MTGPMRDSASAGFAAGDLQNGEVRLDCRVTVSMPAGRRRQVHIRSKVGAFYHDSLYQLFESGLEQCGVTELDVEVDDRGALPFTLLARLEAALRRLQPELDPACSLLADLNPAAQSPARRERLRRTRLYLPGNTPKYFINAGLHHPDMIILDLEDSVSPAEKDAARLLVRGVLRAVDFYGAEKCVRINALPDGLEDILWLAPHGVHTFLLPKVESPEQVRQVDSLLDELLQAGLVTGEIFLLPILESASGMFRALEIAQASRRNVALALGIEDYLRDLGARRTESGAESLWARSQVVNAARAAGLQPLASVFANLEDEAGLLAYAAAARDFGFEGIGCLHPRQVRLAHQAFTPHSEEIEAAGRVVEAYAAALQAGLGVVQVNGRMVDKPVVAQALHSLQLAQAAGVLPSALDDLLQRLV